jgi:hypothetical protein
LAFSSSKEYEKWLAKLFKSQTLNSNRTPLGTAVFIVFPVILGLYQFSQNQVPVVLLSQVISNKSFSCREFFSSVAQG